MNSQRTVGIFSLPCTFISSSTNHIPSERVLPASDRAPRPARGTAPSHLASAWEILAGIRRLRTPFLDFPDCPGPLPALLPSALTLGEGDGRQEQQPQEQQPRAGPRAGGAGSDCRIHRGPAVPAGVSRAGAAGLGLRRLVVPHLQTRFIPAICPLLKLAVEGGNRGAETDTSVEFTSDRQD